MKSLKKLRPQKL